MSRIGDQLQSDRAARDAARAAFDDRIAGLRGSLEQRSVKGRLVDEALARAQAGADEALAVANDSRWVLAATVFALAAWFARKPLGQAVRRLGCPPASGAAAAEPSRWWRRWLNIAIGWVSRKAGS